MFPLQADALPGADVSFAAALTRVHAAARRGLPHHQALPRQKQGPTKNEVLSRAVEHRAIKDAAAKFTTLPDELLADGIGDHYPER